MENQFASQVIQSDPAGPGKQMLSSLLKHGLSYDEWPLNFFLPAVLKLAFQHTLGL